MSRRGRKKQEGKREPNGRLSRLVEEVAKRDYERRSREEVEVLSLGIAAREMRYSLSKGDSMDQKAGSFVGRLRLSGVISTKQYDAAMRWLLDAEEYRWAMGSPRQPAAVRIGAVGGRGLNEEDVSRVQRAYARHELAMRAVQEAQIELRGRGNLLPALQHLVERDIDLQHMVPDLRVALNALSRHYGLTEERAA